jgi:hypothetical protein
MLFDKSTNLASRRSGMGWAGHGTAIFKDLKEVIWGKGLMCLVWLQWIHLQCWLEALEKLIWASCKENRAVQKCRAAPCR